MTTTEVTSFLSNDEPESISFQDSLRFFRRQLADPDNFRITNGSSRHVILPDHTPQYASEDGPKSCRISIPTVDSILESVRVLRAIQKSQSEQNVVDEEKYSTTSKNDGVLNSFNSADVADILKNSNEKSNFWPKKAVDAEVSCSSSNKENFEKNNLRSFNYSRHPDSNEGAHVISRDKLTENDLSKSLSGVVVQVERRTESVSNELNGSTVDDAVHLVGSKEADETPNELVNVFDSLSVLKGCDSETVPQLDTLLNGVEERRSRVSETGAFDSLSIHTSCESSGYSSSVFPSQLLQEELKVPSPTGDESQVFFNSEDDSQPVSKSENGVEELHQTSKTEDKREPPVEDKEQIRCNPPSSVEQQASEEDAEPIAESVEQRPEARGKEEEVSSRKYTTSSWDLVSIVKLLFTVEKVQSPKIWCGEKGSLKRRVFVLSKGSFSHYSEGHYTILFKERALSVLDEEGVCLVLPLTHAEVSPVSDCSLVLDNKVGKCVHFKCESEEELEMLQRELRLCVSRCLPQECIDLVHYPLKCHQKTVIIDLGSCSTRAGILMDQPTLPTLFFPSVCATNKITGEHVYGLDALDPKERRNAAISFPLRPSAKIIKHSVDVDQVTGIFKKIFKDLRIDPEDYAVLVCLPRSLSLAVQSAIVKVLLEELDVKAVSLSHQAILTMYAHDVTTGIVLDIGDRMDVLPVIDGFIVDGGVTRLPYGGRRLIHHMKHALAQKHISLSNDIDSFVVEYISEQLSYVAEDYEKEASLPPQTVRKSVDLTSFARDQTCLKSAVLDEARFKVPEGLFQPELWGLDSPGVHQLVQKAIQAAGVDARKKVAENIYLSGGVTLVPGFVERLLREVTRLNEPRITPKVHASRHRYHSTFIGACRLARMDAFPQVCLTKQEYSRHRQVALKKFALCV